MRLVRMETSAKASASDQNQFKCWFQFLSTGKLCLKLPGKQNVLITNAEPLNYFFVVVYHTNWIVHLIEQPIDEL